MALTLGFILSGMVFYSMWLLGKYTLKIPFILFRKIKRMIKGEKLFKDKEPRRSIYK